MRLPEDQTERRRLLAILMLAGDEHDMSLGKELARAVLELTEHLVREDVVTGSVYVSVEHTHTLALRQRTIEAPNATVVLDYDGNDEIFGVEVLNAVRVDWNGKTMPLPGGEECSTNEIT